MNNLNPFPNLNRHSAKYAIVSSASPQWRELFKITNKLKAEYCEQWGYHLFTEESHRVRQVDGLVYDIRGFVKFDMVGHYLKLPAAINCAKPYEWVVWTDADLLITNKNIRLEDFTKDAPPNCDLILGYDTNGHHSTVFFVRNTQRARDFIWACNNAGWKMFYSHPWHEMEAMRYFMQTPPYNAGFAQYLSAKRLCPIYHPAYQPHVPADIGLEYAWSKGDWSLHLSALSLDKRIILAQFYADPANQHKIYKP